MQKGHTGARPVCPGYYRFTASALGAAEQRLFAQVAEADVLDIVTTDTDARILQYFHAPHAVVKVAAPGVFVALGIIDKSGLEITGARAHVDRAAGLTRAVGGCRVGLVDDIAGVRVDMLIEIHNRMQPYQRRTGAVRQAHGPSQVAIGSWKLNSASSCLTVLETALALL